MKKTELKLMISESNRLLLRDLVVRYSYLTDGYRGAAEDSALVEVYGTDSNGSNLIGSVIMTTYDGYLADEMISRKITGFGLDDYEYIYFLVKADYNDGDLAIDQIDINTTISRSVLK